MPNIKSIKYPSQHITVIAGAARPHEGTCLLPGILVRAFLEGKLEEVLKQIEEDKKKWQISNQ